jgi:hypothetical protein
VNRSHDVEMMWKWWAVWPQDRLQRAAPGEESDSDRDFNTWTHYDTHLREVGPDRASETSSLVLVCYSYMSCGLPSKN